MKRVNAATAATLVLLTLSNTASAQLGGQGMEERRALLRQKMEERIKAMDTDGDGAIDKAEYMANAEQRFNKLDSDGDGRLTAGEQKQAREM